MDHVNSSKRDFCRQLSILPAAFAVAGIGSSRDVQAIEPLTVSALIGALVNLFVHFSNKPDKVDAVATLQSSKEVQSNKTYTDFNMQNSDPSVLVKVYNQSGILLLDYQAPVSTKVFLTVQDGVPYLQYDGLGNTSECNINRWEANTFAAQAQQIGAMPVPSSIRQATTSDPALKSQSLTWLDRKGYDSLVWAPQYVRNSMVNGVKGNQLLVAQNTETRQKNAFWI
jgi:hypothetical protein